VTKYGRFEWDEAKNAWTIEKRSIYFKIASEIFDDFQHVVSPDPGHHSEKQFRMIGKTQDEVVLFVVFTLRNRQIRLISARKASKKERWLYETANR